MRRITFALVILLTLVVATAASAQSQATASANAAASVIAPITITKTADMNFATIVPGLTAGTVVLSPAAVRSNTGGTTLGSATGVAAAAFTVGGEA
ncbi:MAG: DUF4402 domain-containing protein, partial [Thermoanaerobaculia bacterium]